MSVRAPNRVSIQAVEDALRTRADWIVRKLQEAQQRQSDPAACAPVIDGRVVWRDDAHVTGTFARTLAPAIRSALARAAGTD